MSENEYQCAMCGGTFEKEWSDAEAEAEFVRLFPHCQEEPCYMICDDCFRIVCPGGNRIETS